MINVEKTQVRPNTAVGIMYTEPGPLTGHIMLLIMVLMATSAVSQTPSSEPIRMIRYSFLAWILNLTQHFTIRKQCFEAFWYTHQLAIFWAVSAF